MFNASQPTLLILFFMIMLLAACQGQNPLADPTESPMPPTPTENPQTTSTPDPVSVAGFEELLQVVERTNLASRQDVVNRYIARLSATPVTEGDKAVFLWRGEAQLVQVPGDMNNWSVEEAPQLNRLEGTDLWTLLLEVEQDARLDYRFLIDGESWQLDPLNPRSMVSALGPNSELVMPAYQTPPELLPATRVTPVGTLTSHIIESDYQDRPRTIFVYSPPGELIGEKLPSVYFNDGSDFLNLIDTPAILDRLIADRHVPPLVAVFIPPINRDQEYRLNEEYVDFLSEKVVPFIQETYQTDPDPARTAVLGVSLGGVSAVNAVVSHPRVFGLAAGYSGVYSVDDSAIVKAVGRTTGQGVAGRKPRFYLVAGIYETAVTDGENRLNVLTANRRLVNTLEESGYDYLYDERPEGHSWGLWQATLGRGLAFLLGS